jgi:hypothetical protein
MNAQIIIEYVGYFYFFSVIAKSCLNRGNDYFMASILEESQVLLRYDRAS